MSHCRETKRGKGERENQRREGEGSERERERGIERGTMKRERAGDRRREGVYKYNSAQSAKF